MESKTQSGYLVLADISGYTFFIAGTELEHANKAISLLLESIIGKLSSQLTISKLEGDAVFAYLEEGKLQGDKALLLELIAETYQAFRNKAEELCRTSTCPCKACRAIPSLDLKFMVHHGDFIIQQVAGIRDLLGTDVNLIHRLLKNHVSESTGWRGYALLTDQALGRIQADKKAYIQQTESYEHLGQVGTHVMDLHSRYNELKGSKFAL